MKFKYKDLPRKEQKRIRAWCRQGRVLSYETEYGTGCIDIGYRDVDEGMIIEDTELQMINGYWNKEVGGMLEHPSSLLKNLCKSIEGIK